MKKTREFLIILMTMLLTSCSHAAAMAELPPILCSPAIERGQSKNEIRKNWGAPDRIEKLEADETGLFREAWTYENKPFNVFSGNAYVCKTQKLIFGGNHLMRVISGDEILAPEWSS
jgi:hypothetical protein